MAEWLNFVPPLLLLMVYLCECSLEFVEECALKGFTPNLLCSTCELMDDFNLSPIKPSCLECCQKDEAEQSGPVVSQ
ncbi:15 kDa selenoprotein [Biomphalaria glabrata]|nr:15 kDa selenoprotein-like [Biomphalaria glabrata]KAI8771350.1 15 kDa selenoprotein [Biomphalaria glabrata]